MACGRSVSGGDGRRPPWSRPSERSRSVDPVESVVRCLQTVPRSPRGPAWPSSDPSGSTREPRAGARSLSACSAGAGRTWSARTARSSATRSEGCRRRTAWTSAKSLVGKGVDIGVDRRVCASPPPPTSPAADSTVTGRPWKDDSSRPAAPGPAPRSAASGPLEAIIRGDGSGARGPGAERFESGHRLPRSTRSCDHASRRHGQQAENAPEPRVLGHGPTQGRTIGRLARPLVAIALLGGGHPDDTSISS